jgi:hypothetical protein
MRFRVKTVWRLNFLGRPIAPLAITEPMGTKYLLTRRRRGIFCIEPIGFYV